MHGFQHWTQMEMFYNGLNTHTRMVVDAFANRTLLDKSYAKAYEILERIANNDYQYPTTRVGTGRRVAGAMELDVITSLIAQHVFIAEKIMFLMNAHRTQPQFIICEILISRTTTHIPTQIIQGGSNIPILVGVTKGWEIPAMLFGRMLVHHLDTISPCHGKMLSKI
ncbi:retrotransposon gag protein [Gossypium australe]|uniref:Retrotransposon gag protein n=1 Tax=Gossypium australe TaxID=47621 RepID=A0A5B6WID3_9ROSI|nr:retrotransposon gag protein [Gossypium australe]